MNPRLQNSCNSITILILCKPMSTPHLTKQIVVKRNEDRRVVSGHPWVFSNEIRETKGDPVGGEVVELLAASGLSLGIGFYNPHSLIAFRMLSRTIEEIGFEFFHRRIAAALALRATLYPGEATYRVVHGEGDLLPGLIIDKFNDLLVVQAFSYGMDIRLPLISDVLDTLLHPRGIVERNESSLRPLEQLPQEKGIVRGSVGPTTISEHGIKYTIDVLEGQKTGFFLDQRENRLAIRRFSAGARVLDCFCNDGGFSLNAAAGGASSVLGIDSSEQAVQRATRNALLNQATAVRFVQADVFEHLATLASNDERFDVIVLDPPSFTKSRKNVPAAKKGYKELHTSALRVLKKSGILLTACCSHHIEPEFFLSLVDDAARKCGRSLQLIDWRGAAPDHPTLPAVPETRYLKFGVFCVT
jgi:23S rRNA (cytosine1962-C5)-methyltransferase